MITSRSLLLASASLMLPGVCFAQDIASEPAAATAAAAEEDTADASAAADTSDPGGDIVVTGSRLSLSGYRQPTPVTVVGSEKLERDNHTDLASVISKLPSAGNMSSPNSSNASQNVSSGTAGLSLVNLRNLGVPRTLVLFDGKRVVSSTQTGGVDLNLLPQSLVQRIDIVTAGASAAWGSDAVAGVVNVILNKSFTGWGGNIEAATNQRGTRQSLKGELTYGTKIGDRAHLIVSGGYLYSPDHVVPQETGWYKSQNLVNNPVWTPTNGQPRLIHADYVGLSSATQGGLITGGPLRGIQFVGPNGTPVPFDFGNVSGTISNGGTFVNPVLNGQANSLTVPIKNFTGFARLSYDISDKVQAAVELNYGWTHTTSASASYTRQGNLNIQVDNPYLDDGIRQRMIDLGLTSFPLGTTNTNNLNGAAGDDFLEPNGLGNLHNFANRKLFRQLVEFTGELGSWKWEVYGQHSANKRFTKLVVNPVVANYNRAVDAVRVTAANQGSSGLAIGTIVCRSTLTDPGNGCVPLNVLGEGVASPAAIAYVNAGPSESNLTLAQYSTGASIEGEAFSTWAGPVAVAVGAEYRRETVKQTADPLSYARAYAAGNFQFQDFANDVYEGFAEVNVPLVRDGFVETMDFSAAGRYTRYSTSGSVATWKVGLTSQIIPDVRVRATISADIRAPTLLDLFSNGSSSTQVITDVTRPGNPTTNIFALTGGNPNLKPERAKTYTGGVVLTPSFLPGLSASVDYYSIKINGAIVTPLFTYVLSQCAAGDQTFCPFITRDGNGVITTIISSPVNAASVKTSGVDFQLDYRRPVGDGNFTFSLLGNYTHELVRDGLGTVFDYAGSLNFAPPNVVNGEGAPKFRGEASATYATDRYSFTSQLRVIGAGKLNNAYVEGVDVDDNSVPAVAYVDLRASAYLDGDRKVQAYLAVDNVLAKSPPIIPNGPASSPAYFYVPTRSDIYDVLGRSWRVGVRARF